MSLIGKYPCSNVTAPTYLSFLTASCSTLITIVASLGNFLVILVVFLNPSKDLRSPFNYLVVNLSLADLIVGVITAPLGIAFHFFEGLGIPNRPLRKTMHVSFFISCTASLLSLPALALDRYVAIYISSILQIETQRNTKFISFSWCLDRVCFIIHDLLCSRLWQVSICSSSPTLQLSWLSCCFSPTRNFKVLASSS